MAPKKYPCLVCDIEINGKTGSVECSFCEKWVHPKCGNISKAHLDILLSNSTTYWTCEPCHAVAGKIKKEIRHLQNSQEQMRKEMATRMDSLQEEQDTQKTRMDSFEKQLGLLNNDKDNNAAVYKELRERENRRENLVIHQIPEASGSMRGGDRREHDASLAMELFQFIGCPVRREEIKFIYRPGEIPESGRPRPVILSLMDESIKKRILSNTRKLANSKFERVSIIPDLTPQQRKEEEEQRKEVDKLNSELTHDESLNWEWVLVGPRGRRRLIKRKRIHGGEGENRWGERGNWRGRGANWRGGEGERRMSSQNSQLRDSRWDMDGVRETVRGPTRGNQRGRGNGSLRGTGRRPFNQNLESERDQERAREGEEVIGTQAGEDGRNRHIRATPILREGRRRWRGRHPRGRSRSRRANGPEWTTQSAPPKTRRKRRRPKCSENNLP